MKNKCVDVCPYDALSGRLISFGLEFFLALTFLFVGSCMVHSRICRYICDMRNYLRQPLPAEILGECGMFHLARAPERANFVMLH
jgi:hypothetical protein